MKVSKNIKPFTQQFWSFLRWKYDHHMNDMIKDQDFNSAIYWYELKNYCEKRLECYES